MNHNFRPYIITLLVLLAVGLECYRVNMSVPADDAGYAVYSANSWTIIGVSMVVMASVLFWLVNIRPVRVLMVLLILLHGYVILKVKLGFAGDHSWFDWIFWIVGAAASSAVLFGKKVK